MNRRRFLLAPLALLPGVLNAVPTRVTVTSGDRKLYRWIPSPIGEWTEVKNALTGKRTIYRCGRYRRA